MKLVTKIQQINRAILQSQPKLSHPLTSPTAKPKISRFIKIYCPLRDNTRKIRILIVVLVIAELLVLFVKPIPMMRSILKADKNTKLYLSLYGYKLINPSIRFGMSGCIVASTVSIISFVNLHSSPYSLSSS